jgi:hypothetical protein
MLWPGAMSEIAFALVLALAAVVAALIGARAGKTTRAYLTFAAALYASLAVADAAFARLPEEADAVALLVTALAPASLALALAGRAVNAGVATLVLFVCLLAGLFAAMTGEALAAFAPLFAGVCAMLAMALRKRLIYAGFGALAFLAAAASFMAAGAHMAFMLFSAAGLIGAALASGGQVAGKRKLARALAIGRHR